ncbi:carboxypeptidase regulatory-like domain-containing protein, partial [Conexibacter woesei]|uniref:carboxypeptidase regulatory-like domain-containing protein n=1 Tax=Conexibacter woesei TaxID=191495 RepID=UPI0012DE2184
PPAGSGLATALITLPTITNNTTINVQLRGDQVVAVALSPDRETFDRTLPGQSSAATTFRLTNISGPSLAVSGATLASGDAADFHLASSTCSATSLAVGASCSFQASFVPTTTGTKNASLVVTDSGPGSPHTIALSGRGVANQVAGQVVGRKVDGTTAPLAGVTVEVKSSSTTVATATTGADGKYAIPLDDGSYQVTFTPPADGPYSSLTQSVDVPTSSSLDVALTPKDALRLSGTVRSSLGVPVRGVHVVVDDNTAAAQTTGPDGAYAAAVAPGDHRITLSGDTATGDSLPDRWTLPLSAITVSGDRPALDLTLPPVYTLTTRVLTGDGDPLQGADVTNLQLPVATTELAPGITIGASATMQPSAATTDARGLARNMVFRSTSGHGTVAAGAHNPATTFDIPAVTRDTTVSVRADGSSSPIVSYLTGTVRSALGQALPGVRLTSTGTDTATVTTGADGTFQSAVAAGSRTFELDADGIQQAGLPKDWQLPTGATTLQSDRTLDFALPAVHTLTVRVLDGSDQPVPGAVVTGADGGATLDLPVAPTQIASGLTTTDAALSRPAAATTAADGTATFHVFANSTSRALIVTASGHAQTPFTVPAASGDTTVTVHVATPPTRTVRGVVRSASGDPIAGVQIAIGSQSTRSDADG